MDNSVRALYENFAQADSRAINALQGQFEDILGVKVEKKVFASLYLDAKYFRGFSTVHGSIMSPLYLESKGRLPLAVNFLYKRFSRKAFDRSRLSADHQKLLDQVLDEGYCVVENFLTASQVEQFREEMASFDFSASQEQIKMKYDLKKLRNENIEADPAISVYYTKFTGQNIAKNSQVGRSLIDPLMADITSAYFGSQAYLTDVSGLFTRAKDPKYFTKTDVHRNAQSWHYDYPNFRFLTCFLYLTDVGPQNGPHTFAINTHEEKLVYPAPIEEQAFMEGSFRRFSNGHIFGKIKDEWVLNAVGKERIKEFCLPKGSLIIENTSGLHKGGYCYAGTREMVGYTYSISNTARPSTVPTLDYEPEFPYEGHLVPVLKCLKEEQLDVYNAFAPKPSFTTRIKGKIKGRIKALTSSNRVPTGV